MWALQAALLMLALLASTGPSPTSCALVVPSAQVKWIKAELSAVVTPNTVYPWRDCVTTCANAGLSSVTAGDMAVYSPLLCGPKAGKELCAIAVTAVNDTPHVPHNVHYLPGTRYTSPTYNLNSCNNVPCWVPLQPVTSPNGASETRPPYKPVANDIGYYCGCLPNPLEFWGAWTKGAQGRCLVGPGFPGPGYTKTDGSALNPIYTGFHLGAICRITKPPLPVPATIDPQGLMGFVRDGKVCVFQYHTLAGSSANGVAMEATEFDRLCVREEMAALPELIP